MNYRVLFAAGLLALVSSANALDPLPAGWQPMLGAGPDGLPGVCELGVDGDLVRAGISNMTIKCQNDIPSFGGLRNPFDAAPYWGKRVRFSAYLQAEGILDFDNAKGSGGLWIAVGSPQGMRQHRIPEIALTGWTSWEYREVVVDVPEGGNLLQIGFWMQGNGQIWIREIKFEEVPLSVPATLVLDDVPPILPNVQLR